MISEPPEPPGEGHPPRPSGSTGPKKKPGQSSLRRKPAGAAPKPAGDPFDDLFASAPRLFDHDSRSDRIAIPESGEPEEDSQTPSSPAPSSVTRRPVASPPETVTPEEASATSEEDSATASTVSAGQPPQLQDQLLDNAPLVIAALAGFVSLFFRVNPTGTALWDPLLVIALIGVVTLAAPRCTKFPLLALTLVPFLFLGLGVWKLIAFVAFVAAASQDWRTEDAEHPQTEQRPEQPPSAAGRVLAPVLDWLATTVSQRTANAIAAGTGAAAILGLLRMPDAFTINRSSAVLTAVVVLPVLWSAIPTLTAEQKLLTKRILVGSIGIVVLGSTLAFFSVITGRSAAEAGVQRAEQGLNLARAGKQGQAIARLAESEQHFTDAESRFAAFWAKPARLVPIIAQNHRSTQVAAAQGRALTSAAQAAAGTANIDQVRGTDGQLDLPLLRKVGAELAITTQTLTDAGAAISSAQSPWLLPPLGNGLADALDLIVEANDDVSLAAEAARVLPSILGGDGARTYLVMFTNPAEPREFGGFASAYAFITADNGKVSVLDAGYGGDLDLPDDVEPLPQPGFAEAATFPQPYLNYGANGLINYYGNLTGTIDFPTIARAAQQAMPIKGHPEIDGVMVIDPFALAAMMELVDLEVVVPETGATLNKDTLARYIMIDQYNNEDGVGLGAFNSINARTEALVSAGEQIFRSLLSGTLPGPERLGEVLGPAARAKRLQFTTFEGDEIQLLQALYLRSNTPFPGENIDFVHFALDSAVPNKLDPYIARDIDYVVDFEPATGRYFAEFRITLTNNSPEGLPDYVQGVPGDYYGLEPGDHRARISLWNNHQFATPLVEGAEPARSQKHREFGHYRTLVFVEIPRGESRTVTLNFDGALAPGRYEVFLGSQPLATPLELDLTVNAPDGWQQTTTGQPSYSIPIELDEDIRFALAFEES